MRNVTPGGQSSLRNIRRVGEYKWAQCKWAFRAIELKVPSFTLRQTDRKAGIIVVRKNTVILKVNEQQFPVQSENIQLFS